MVGHEVKVMMVIDLLASSYKMLLEEGMEKYTLLKNKNTGTNMDNISGEHNRVHLKIDSV